MMCPFATMKEGGNYEYRSKTFEYGTFSGGNPF